VIGSGPARHDRHRVRKPPARRAQTSTGRLQSILDLNRCGYANRGGSAARESRALGARVVRRARLIRSCSSRRHRWRQLFAPAKAIDMPMNGRPSTAAALLPVIRILPAHVPNCVAQSKLPFQTACHIRNRLGDNTTTTTTVAAQATFQYEVDFPAARSSRQRLCALSPPRCQDARPRPKAGLRRASRVRSSMAPSRIYVQVVCERAVVAGD